MNIKLASIPRKSAGESIWCSTHGPFMLVFQCGWIKAFVVKSHVSFLGQGHGSLFLTCFQLTWPWLSPHAHNPVSILNMAKTTCVYSLIFWHDISMGDYRSIYNYYNFCQFPTISPWLLGNWKSNPMQSQQPMTSSLSVIKAWAKQTSFAKWQLSFTARKV